MLDTRYYDEDVEETLGAADDDEDGSGESEVPTIINHLRTDDHYRKRAAEVHVAYSGPLKCRFKWLAEAGAQ